MAENCENNPGVNKPPNLPEPFMHTLHIPPFQPDCPRRIVRQWESGPVGSFVRRILVKDADGAQLELYEYRDRVAVLGLWRVRKVRRMELDTGESVEYIDENAFVVTATGETLKRVK